MKAREVRFFSFVAVYIIAMLVVLYRPVLTGTAGYIIMLMAFVGAMLNRPLTHKELE